MDSLFKIVLKLSSINIAVNFTRGNIDLIEKINLLHDIMSKKYTNPLEDDKLL